MWGCCAIIDSKWFVRPSLSLSALGSLMSTPGSIWYPGITAAGSTRPGSGSSPATRWRRRGSRGGGGGDALQPRQHRGVLEPAADVHGGDALDVIGLDGLPVALADRHLRDVGRSRRRSVRWRR